jgi:hypothetical protein
MMSADPLASTAPGRIPSSEEDDFYTPGTDEPPRPQTGDRTMKTLKEVQSRVTAIRNGIVHR